MIRAFVGTTLVDFPGRIAAAVFTGGCSFACPFCHNTALVQTPHTLPTIPIADVLAELQRRRDFLDGVVISGGEPLLHPELTSFIAAVREIGLQVKLDTNGYYPQSLAALLRHAPPDYIAMDIKSSPERYGEAAGRPITRARLDATLRLLREWQGETEYRTTVVPGLVGAEEIEEITRWIAGHGSYVLQPFIPETTLHPDYRRRPATPAADLRRLAALAARFHPHVSVRGLHAVDGDS